MSRAIRSHFFKIVLEQTLRDGKIKIPAGFVEEHGDVMQGKIQLEDPTGLVWDMKLSNRDGEVWMQDGWKEFAEHYSLRYGHFLVFKYEGNSHFRVIIFDMSALEIDYPISAHPEDSESTEGFQEQNMEEDDKDDVSIEILDSDPSCSKKIDHPFSAHPGDSVDGRLQEQNMEEDAVSIEILDSDPSCRKKKEISSQLDCYPPQKIMKTRSNCRPARNSTLAQATKDSGLSRPSKTELDTSKKHSGSLSIAKQGQTENPLTKPPVFSANRKADALQKAQAFHSENPFFMVLLKHHYIYIDYRLGIPLQFANLYLKKNSAEVILRISEKTWIVKYILKVSKGKKFPRFQRGWKYFVQDNNLSVGDVCVFELSKGRQIILDVTIFRVMEKQCNRWTPESVNGTGMNQPCKKTDCRTKAEPGPSGNSWGMKAQNLHIQEFDDDDDNDDSSIQILYDKSCSKEGEKPPSRVPKIIRNAKEHSTENVAAGNIQNSSCFGSRQAIKDSIKFTSGRPSFKATMREYNMTFTGAYVPVWFMKTIGTRVENVILRAEGGSWKVRLVRNQNRGYLSAGWTEFTRQNRLEQGDVCVFELIKTGNVELKVSISRRPK